MTHRRPSATESLWLAGILLLTVQACRSEPGGLPTTDPELLGGAFAIYPEPADPADPTSGAADDENPWLRFGEEDPGAAGTGAASANGATGPGSAEEPPDAGTFTGSGGQGPGPASLEPANPATSVEVTAPLARLRLLGYFESTTAAKLLIVEHLGGGASSACNVEIYSNGGTEPWRTFVVPDGLLPGDRHVLCLPDAHHPACSQVSGGSAFNGNDAVRLACAGTTHDVIGTIGVDPGTAWTGPGFREDSVSTANSGLWRCQSPGPADAPFSAFSLSEWSAWDPNADPTLAGPACTSPAAEGGEGGEGGALTG